MKIGLQIPSFTWAGGPSQIKTKLAEIGKTADEAGFASIWVMDHFFQIRGVGKVDEPMLESYTALGYLAAVTKKARLGTMVTGVIYRHPGILVKTVTTLDVLSGGRAYLGIGAAWNEQESRGLGVPFPPLKERFERLEEALQIARQMWAGQVAPFEGKYYHLEQTLNVPQAITKPHPPILIGGMGETKTLKLVAKYADACNLFGRTGVEVIRHKLDILKEHCNTIGRRYEEIEKTALDTVQIAPKEMSSEQMIDLCGSLHQAGIQHLIVNMPNVADIKPLETIGEKVIPAVASL
jgi:F420-dependent oxidoreductase-like protein